MGFGQIWDAIISSLPLFGTLKKVVNTDFLYIYTSFFIPQLIILFALFAAKLYAAKLNIEKHHGLIDRGIAYLIPSFIVTIVIFPLYLITFNHKTIAITLISNNNDATGS